VIRPKVCRDTYILYLIKEGDTRGDEPNYLLRETPKDGHNPRTLFHQVTELRWRRHHLDPVCSKVRSVHEVKRTAKAVVGDDIRGKHGES
jgi:hypothetical protein